VRSEVPENMAEFKREADRVEIRYPRVLTEEDVQVPDDFHGDPDEYTDQIVERSRRRADQAILESLFVAIAESRAESENESRAEDTQIDSGTTTSDRPGPEGDQAHAMRVMDDPRIRYGIFKYLTPSEVLKFGRTCRKARDWAQGEEYWAVRWYQDFGPTEYCAAVNRRNAECMTTAANSICFQGPVGLLGISLRQQYMYLRSRQQLSQGLRLAQIAPRIRAQSFARLEPKQYQAYTALIQNIATHSDGVEAAADIATLSKDGISPALAAKCETKIMTGAYRKAVTTRAGYTSQ